MTVGLHTTVQGWRFVGRGVIGDPAGLLVEETGGLTSTAKGRGDLYVLVDVGGRADGRDEIARQLAMEIRRTYASERGSITGGLRQAVLAANQTLLQMNQTLPSDKQRTASIAGLVMRGRDAYLAHVGDVATAVVRDGQTLLWEAVATPETVVRLGAPGGRDLDVELYHVDIQAGYTFLLAGGGLARLTRPEPLAASIHTKGLRGALAALTSGGSIDLLALGIELSGEPAAPEAVPPRERLGPAGTASRPPEVVRGESRAAERPTGVGRGVGKAALAGLGVIILLVRNVVTLLGRSWAIPPRVEADEVGRESAAERRTRRREERKVGLWPVVLLLTIPLAVALVAGAIYWQRGREQETRYEQLVTEAQALFQQGTQAADTTQARGSYVQVLDRARQAEQIHPGTETLQALREEVRNRLRQVDQVKPLYGLAPLWTYEEANSRPRRVVSHGQDIFVLDVGTGTVHRHVLSESREVLAEETQDQVILRRGETVGGVVVRDILDIAWMPAGGKRTQSSLLALDAGGQIISWQPNWGTQVVQVYGTQNWRTPSLMTSFTQGRLYILDAPQRQVLRYLPTTEGYTSPPEMYFVSEGGENLQGVTDMAIDGSLYLVYTDGRIVKYETGQPLPFVAQAPPDGWKGPVALFTGPEAGTSSAVRYLYVADAGGQRVVRLTKDGKFSCQYLAPDSDAQALTDLAGFSVDEGQNLLFLVSGRTLYRAPMPLDQ